MTSVRLSRKTMLISTLIVLFVVVGIRVSHTQQAANLKGDTDNSKLIKKWKADGLAKLPGSKDIPGAVDWCWNKNDQIVAQDCPWLAQTIFGPQTRHSIIWTACKVAAATDCAAPAQVADYAANCQCHNPPVAQEMRDHPAETCAAVRKYGC